MGRTWQFLVLRFARGGKPGFQEGLVQEVLGH